MKRTISIILAIVVALGALVAFSACSGNTGDDNNADVLRVGLECAYAPFNWTQLDDSNDAVAIEGTNQFANGYDVQIARRIAEGLGKELVVVKLDWDGLIPAVQSGAVDGIIAGMSPTAEREEEVDFTECYYNSNLVIIYKVQK